MKSIFLVGCGVLLTGCARLGVDVHIFDRHNAACFQEAFSSENELDEIAELLYQDLEQLKAPQSIPNKDAFKSSFRNPLIQEDFRKTYATSDSGQGSHSNWQDKLVTEVAKADTTWSPDPTAIKERLGQSAKTHSNTIGTKYKVHDDRLVDDPNASVVLYAPESCWSAQYGKANGYGYFGNSDIAIKMEGPGNFVVKGLRLDASKMTQALFKGLNQGLMLLTSAYGVPSSKSGTGQQATEPDSVYDDVASAEQLKLDSTFSIQQSRDRLLRLFEEIVAQRAALDDDKTFKAALTNIKTTVANYRTQVELAK